MDAKLSDFLTRLIAIRREDCSVEQRAEQAIDGFYRYLGETGIEHCNFGGWLMEADGTPSLELFNGTRLPAPFIEEFTEELAVDDYVLRKGENLDRNRPIERFDIGMHALDEIAAFHGPSKRVQEECARHGIVEGKAIIGDTSLVAGGMSGGGGRFFGFVYAGEVGTNRVIEAHATDIEIASFALLDQIMPHVEATMDGFSEALTGRERDVLAALASGEQRKQIAFRFNVSLPTVDMYLANLKRKLAAQTLAEAVAKGYRYGLL